MLPKIQNSTDTSLKAVREKINKSEFMQIVNSDNYPLSIRQSLGSVAKILSNEKAITDLYPEILAEIPISTSQFQDTCVQMEQHFTPHRKLRQCMLEMQDKLNALYAAKTGHKKAVLKLERIKFEMENLQKEIDACKDPFSHDSESEKRLTLAMLESEVEFEESSRGVESSRHMIKDAMLKVVQQQTLIDRYKAEVEKSGLSFEEAEVYYYVMYFTSDAERQLRTMGRVDTGTFGAISQLPTPIRLKVLKNIAFLEQKIIKEGYPISGDYLFKVYKDELEPTKTGAGEIEGLNVSEFLGIETIKLLSK